MRRLLMIAACAGLVVAFACGDDDDTARGDGETGPSGEPTATVTADPNAAPTKLPARPSPTPAAEDGEALTIYAPDGSRVKLTLGDFRSIATATVEGFSERGATLDALASQVGFEGEASVTFRGYRPGAGTFQFAVGSYSELRPNTVIYITPAGHLALKSGGLAESTWLTVVDEVRFD